MQSSRRGVGALRPVQLPRRHSELGPLKIQIGAGSRAPPHELPSASGKGKGSAAPSAPGPSCPPGHHGEPQKKVWGPGAGTRPLPGAQLLPGNILAPAAPGDGAGWCGGSRLASHPSKRRKCGGDVRRRGVPLGAAGDARQAGWQRRAVPSLLGAPAGCLLPPARRRTELRRRGSAEPGAARAGEAGSRRGSERYPAAAAGRARRCGGEGAAGTSPRPPTLRAERMGRPPLPAPHPGHRSPRGGAAAAFCAAFGSPRAWSGPLLTVPSHADSVQSVCTSSPLLREGTRQVSREAHKQNSVPPGYHGKRCRVLEKKQDIQP